MKKLSALFLSAVLLLGLSACGASTTQPATGSAAPVSDSDSGSASAASQEEMSSKAADSTNVLVVYYSASGHTKAVANEIADATGGDTLELVPTKPYTDEDLDYTNDDSRVCKEYADESLRSIPLEADSVDNWEQYDTVFIGYPIWWGIAAWPVNTFVENNDFTDKTVIPFCTSASSGLGDSGSLLEQLAGTGNWQDGIRFSSSAPADEVSACIDDLGLSN